MKLQPKKALIVVAAYAFAFAVFAVVAQDFLWVALVPGTTMALTGLRLRELRLGKTCLVALATVIGTLVGLLHSLSPRNADFLGSVFAATIGGVVGGVVVSSLVDNSQRLPDETRYQFSLGDLVWSVTLFGAALGMLLAGRRDQNPLTVFLAVPLAGAGLGALRQRKAVGFAWGFLIGLVMFCFLLPSVQAARE